MPERGAGDVVRVIAALDGWEDVLVAEGPCADLDASQAKAVLLEHSASDVAVGHCQSPCRGEGRAVRPVSIEG